jgi:hypothetical protein
MGENGCSVSLFLRFISREKKCPWYLLNRTLDGTQTRSGILRKIKMYLSMKGFSNSILGSEAQSFDTIWDLCVSNIITNQNYT